MKINEKILVVEDEADIAELVKLYLEKYAFQVVTVENGEQALHAFHVEQPKLIILDVLLPGMNGLDVCREIRKLSNLPIIFLSCKRETEDIVLGLEAGGNDYLTKPFDPSVLVARVKAHLRSPFC